MNIENIYTAVEEDEMNSPLITICGELVKQGYDVKVEGVEFTNDESCINLFSDLEFATNEINFVLTKNNKRESFKLVFTDYHKFEIQE